MQSMKMGSSAVSEYSDSAFSLLANSLVMASVRCNRRPSSSPNRCTFALVTFAALSVLALFVCFTFLRSLSGVWHSLQGMHTSDLQIRFHVDNGRPLERNTEVFMKDTVGHLKNGKQVLQGQGEAIHRATGLVENSTEVVEDRAVSYPGPLQKVCNEKSAILKVFMYDLPPEFHFGMINELPNGLLWPRNASQAPSYPGGMNQQHSTEYWLTLDLLTSTFPNRNFPCSAFRVEDSKKADIFFVPFFSSLSYNKFSRLEGNDRNIELQERLVQYLMGQHTWRRSGGRNHVIVMHHPNSLHAAREQLRPAMFIVSDFGRYSPQVANVGKDIVAPYKHAIPTFKEDTSTYESRHTLLFFQGAIVRKDGGYIRQRLYEMLKGEPGVHFATGNTERDGIRSATQGMRSSKFCLHLAGDTPSSNRLFDAIASHCVPVIISDELELPFEDELDYSEFCLFIRSSDSLQRDFVIKLLESVEKSEWIRMWKRLKQVDHYFEYRYPAQIDDSVNMIWKSIARRLPSIKQSLHKGKRYSRSRLVTRG